VQELVILEHHADELAEFGDAPAFHRKGVLVVDEHLPARGAFDERNQLEDAAFAGT